MLVLVGTLGLQGISRPGHAGSGNCRGRPRVARGTAQAGRTIGWPAFCGRIALPIIRSHAGPDDHGSRPRDRQCSCGVSLTGATDQTRGSQSPPTQAAAAQRPAAQGYDTFCEPLAKAAQGPHSPSIAHSAPFARALAPTSLGSFGSECPWEGPPTFCASYSRPIAHTESFLLRAMVLAELASILDRFNESRASLPCPTFPI
jgi:hypothetical protein